MKETIEVTLPSQDLNALNHRAKALGLTPSQLLHRIVRHKIRKSIPKMPESMVCTESNIWNGEWINDFTKQSKKDM